MLQTDRCLSTQCRRGFTSLDRGPRIPRSTSLSRLGRSPSVLCSMAKGRADGGLGVLEWTGSLIPQGVLVKGVKTGWRLAWETMMKELAPQDRDGSYSRPKYSFNNRIGDPGFPAESGRYHLYVGNACPWCHRVILALIFRGLLPHISITHATDDPERASRGGWVFDTPEPCFGCTDLRQVYDRVQPGYRGRCTAPLLIDKVAGRAVSNESSELVAMLNDLHLPGCSPVDLRPAHLQPELDSLNHLIYDKVNNGVYKCGFSTSQQAYEAAMAGLAEALEGLERRLQSSRFLLGPQLTEADLRLYPTAIRYDSIYAILFKCCWTRIADYPNLSGWMRDVYHIRMPGDGSMQVKDSFNLKDAQRSYFSSLFPLNPGGIVPGRPNITDLGLDKAPDRGPLDTDTVFYRRPAAVGLPDPALV